MYLAIGIPGGFEWLIILLIVVIFFGVGQLPKVLGQMGKGVRAFKDGMNTDEEDKELKEIEAQAAAFTEAEEVRAKQASD
ncbi:MAG: Sec-independent protein translocase subunit TatA [Myxococcota bacterium]